MYITKVRFYQYNKWSKGYSYLSDVKYEKYTIVIVPAGKLYSIGLVESSTELTQEVDISGLKKIIRKVSKEFLSEYDKPE